MPAKFEVYKDKKGEFRFRLLATNGQTIATGESYPTKAACLKGIASIQKNAPVAEIVEEDAEKKAEKQAPKATKAKTATKAKPAAKPKATGKPRGRKPKNAE
jgi:uncharacterized protein YegP (UPF0339 family)